MDAGREVGGLEARRSCRLLTYQHHVVAPYELDAELNAFFDDRMRAGQALEPSSAATKPAFEIPLLPGRSIRTWRPSG